MGRLNPTSTIMYGGSKRYPGNQFLIVLLQIGRQIKHFLLTAVNYLV